MKPELETIDDNDTELVTSLTSVAEEGPFAIVEGEPLTELPKDLYIPPGALQVFLEAFSGPLDLLLYLIRKQNLDILDIPIADITRQYTQYIELMQELELELAGEYLLMAAMLAEIKSRMLLPRPAAAGEEEEDPRAELVRRLQEYERFKKAAEDLDALPRLERDALLANAELVERKVVRREPDVTLKEMLRAIKAVLKRADMFAHHHIQREPLSVRQRMTDILTTLQRDVFVPFVSLFRPEEGRMGVTVTFMAVLELMREALVEIVQAEPYAPLHVRPKTSADAAAAAASDVADAENEAALAQPALEGEDEVEPLEDWEANAEARVEHEPRNEASSDLPESTPPVRWPSEYESEAVSESVQHAAIAVELQVSSATSIVLSTVRWPSEYETEPVSESARHPDVADEPEVSSETSSDLPIESPPVRWPSEYETEPVSESTRHPVVADEPEGSSETSSDLPIESPPVRWPSEYETEPVSESARHPVVADEPEVSSETSSDLPTESPPVRWPSEYETEPVSESKRDAAAANDAKDAESVDSATED